MEGICVYIKEEQPWEETYAEGDGLNPMIGNPSLENESKASMSSPLEGPSIKDEPDSLSTSQDCSEFLLGEGLSNLVKEEVDFPPFDDAASSTGSVKPAQFKMNPKITTEKVEEKSVKSNCQKQSIEFGIRKMQGAEGDSLTPDDSYGNLKCNLMPSESTEFLKDKSYRKSELDDSTTDSKKNFLCSMCSKLFSTKRGLTNHMQIHAEIFSHICQHCGKGFCYKYDLQRHNRTHTGEKPFRCTECGKSFNDQSHLKRHLLTHTKHLRTRTAEKPHQCLVCMTRFSQSSSLIIHMKSFHLKLKPFKCSFCDKCFSQNCHLKEHERIHTEEKPFDCKICLKRFVQLDGLKEHQQIHT